MPNTIFGTSVCGLCLCSSDSFRVISSELRISLPSCQSEPTAEETVIKSARRIRCFLIFRRSLEVKVESQKLSRQQGKLLC